MAPSLVAVTSCLTDLERQSPAAKKPGNLVLQSESVIIKFEESMSI